MKKTIKESLKVLIADRYLLAILSLLVVLSVVISIMIGLSIKPSDSQLVTHYSAFSDNNIYSLYRDQWFYLFVFVIFQLTVAVLHIIVSVKILITKGRSLAIAFAWMGVSILLIGWIVAYSIINFWKPI